MTRLLKPDEVPGNCALIDSQLKSPLSMRSASHSEISLIRKAIIAGQAKFEYIFDKEEVIKILKRHLSSLEA